MGTVKDILEFFVTFGIVDNIIIYMFFRKFGNCPKNKWYQIGALALIGSVMKFIFPPVIYQIFLYLIIIGYNKIINKFNLIKSIKITVYLFIYSLILETFTILFLDLFTEINFVEIKNIFIQFILMIPSKLFSILILKGDLLWGLFGMVKTQKKK